MIRADQIPDEVVEALHTSLADDAGVLVPKSDCVTAIAAALNAWPGSEYVYRQPHRRAVSYSSPAIILPLPQEASDE